MKNSIPVFILISFISLNGFLFSQTASQNGKKQDKPANGNESSVNESEEMDLGDIEVKGKVEKPGVTIMPKRIEPKLEEKELQRDFDKEIKEDMEGIYRPNKELSKVERVKSIKKAIDKKRD